MQKTSGSIWGCALLIGGNAIGAGMLAMPVVSAPLGFLPSTVSNLLTWFVMLCTGLAVLEVCFWMERGSHFLSMSERFLGTFGKVACMISFPFLYYCLMTGYLSACGPMISQIASYSPLFAFSDTFWMLILATLTVLTLYLGTGAVDRLNWVLMMGLGISFIALVFIGSQEVELSLLSHSSWSGLLWITPTLFGSYGYHNIIPSIADYMERDTSLLRKAVIVGTLIPLAVYLIWQFVILGSIPLLMLQDNLASGMAVTATFLDIEQLTGSSWVPRLGLFFSFFALVTSLLVIALSVVDFLADAFNWKKEGVKRLILTLMTILPPLLFALGRPSIFLSVIGVAGGYGEALINSLIPLGMLWVGRYHRGFIFHTQLPGGKSMIVLLFLFTLVVIGIETLQLLGFTL